MLCLIMMGYYYVPGGTSVHAYALWRGIHFTISVVLQHGVTLTH